jgi:transposase
VDLGAARPDPRPDPRPQQLEAAVRRGRARLSLDSRARLYFQTRPGTYKRATLLSFVQALKRHFRGHRIILLWDGLGAHTSRGMRAYLAGQRAWLRVESLPAYDPELNPVEPHWGNVKSRVLANYCAPDLDALGRSLRAGLSRVPRHPTLALSFLRHAGLAL